MVYLKRYFFSKYCHEKRTLKCIIRIITQKENFEVGIRMSLKVLLTCCCVAYIIYCSLRVVLAWS